MTALTALPLDRPDAVAARIEAHLAGGEPLTGLELYYELERATPLMHLHGLLRLGPQNRAASGLQQSYGDHNRLLLLGLDRLLAGDVAWFRGRVAPGEAVDDDALVALMAKVRSIGLDRRAEVALWLGAALHDCGMIGGRGAHLDVEDGVVIGGDVVRALCAPDLVDLALFAVRHHDYIKDVFHGGVPVSLVAQDLAALPVEQQAVALAVLGLIQVAGSASLGEGRLGRFRLEIFDRCADGSALADEGVGTRLARLLQADGSTTAAPTPDDRSTSEALVDLLTDVPIHGWPSASAGVAAPDRWQGLTVIADAWAARGGDHVALASPLGAAGTGASTDVALNGTRVLVLG